MKGIFEGLCQAKNAKMKMSIAPALAASANSGFRPPAEDNKTILNGTRDCLRKPGERWDERLTKRASSFRGAAPQKVRGLCTFKARLRPGPSAVSPSTPHAGKDPRAARRD